MKPFRTIVIAILMIIAVLSWRESPEAPPTVDTADEMAEHKVDYYLADFSIDTLAPDGRRKHNLSGDILTHYADNDTAEIDVVKLILNRQDKADWFITSDKGLLAAGATYVDLQGKVAMIRDRTANTSSMRIDSHDMRLNMKSNTITTDRAVVIVSEGWKAEGDGLRGNTETGDISLLNNVEFTYAPPL